MAMSTHELKAWPKPFQAVWDERKRFEFRVDDRQPRFAVDDYLHLREWDPVMAQYSGRLAVARVTYLVRGPSFGIPEGYVVLSIGYITRYPRGD
jgi:hypothetical protein